jgi:hypothetical protein
LPLTLYGGPNLTDNGVKMVPSTSQCGGVVRNDLICRIAAHVDFRFPIDTGGGLRLSAAYQADDIFGQTKRCRLAKIFASMHRSSATASATVEAFGSDP